MSFRSNWKLDLISLASQVKQRMTNYWPLFRFESFSSGREAIPNDSETAQS